MEQNWLPPVPPGEKPTENLPPPPPPQGEPGLPPPPPPTYTPPPGYSYPAQPYTPEPDNTPAVVGFVLSICSGALLLTTIGMSSVISVGLSIGGMLYSRNGKKKIEAGETRKHEGIAQAGWIIGIVGLVLAVLATLFWVAIIVLAITGVIEDSDTGTDFEFDRAVLSALIAAFAR